MSDANQTTNLEQFPDSAIEVVHGKVQRLNRIAMHRFPELRSGMELPGFLSTPLKDPDGAGTFTHQGVLYLFSRVAGTAGSLLLVLLFSSQVVHFNDVLNSLFPVLTVQYWYVTAYVGLFFFIPFLNVLGNRLTKSQFQYLLVTVFVLFSVVPSFLHRDVFPVE